MTIISISFTCIITSTLRDNNRDYLLLLPISIARSFSAAMTTISLGSESDHTDILMSILTGH